jgi:hypothetical protein
LTGTLYVDYFIKLIFQPKHSRLHFKIKEVKIKPAVSFGLHHGLKIENQFHTTSVSLKKDKNSFAEAEVCEPG